MTNAVVDALDIIDSQIAWRERKHLEEMKNKRG